MLIKKNKEVISWSFYDFANQPFSTVILTFIYGTFFTQYIAKDSEGTFLWTVGISITAIIASILSPLLGAYSDSKGFRKQFFVLFTWMCVFFSCMLYFPELGDVCLALSLFIAANISFELATVFYNSYLPDISTNKNIGKISGYSWGLGFLGGLLALFFILFYFKDLSPTDIRKSNIFVGLWIFIFSIPSFIYLKDVRIKEKQHTSNPFKSIKETFYDISKYKRIVWFLVARIFYNDALITIFALGGIYASEALGFTVNEVLILGIALNITAAIGSFIFGYIEDLIGQRRVINITLVCLIFATILAFISPYFNTNSNILTTFNFFILDFTINISYPKFIFWLSAIIMGLMIGPNQSCSRSLMSTLIPVEKKSEFFGFFAFTGKATSFLGPLLFGLVAKIYSHQAGLLVVIAFFLIGLFLFNFTNKEKFFENK